MTYIVNERQYSAVLAQHHEEKARVNVPDKFAKYFRPNPGEGD